MISREELYRLVWSEPMTKASEPFKVSGSYLARVCAQMNIPRPDRGYWAKLAVGKAMPPVPLPDEKPGDQLYWSKDGENRPPPRLLRPKTPPKRSRKVEIQVPKGHIHGLIRGAKELIEKSWPVGDAGYLKPHKKILVDVTASPAGLSKALAFANDLFNAFESVGHRVILPPSNERLRRTHVDEREVRTKKRDTYYQSRLWSPYRPTVVYIGNVAIGLVIIEMSEEVLMRYVGGKYIREADYVPPNTSRHRVNHTWTTTSELPCGRLRLMAYSPYWSVGWDHEWQETQKMPLDLSIQSIVKSIEKAAVELVDKLAEADRQAEIARLERIAAEEKRLREEDRRQVTQAEQDSEEHLREIIQQWSDTVAVESFLAGVEERASKLTAESREKIIERLNLARQLLGNTDPLDVFLSWKTPKERYRSKYESDESGRLGSR